MSAMPHATPETSWRNAVSVSFFSLEPHEDDMIEAALCSVPNLGAHLVAAAEEIAPAMPFPYEVDHVPARTRLYIEAVVAELSDRTLRHSLTLIATRIRPQIEAAIREASVRVINERGLHAELRDRARAIETVIRDRAEAEGGLLADDKRGEWELSHLAAGVVAAHIVQGLDIEEAEAAAWRTMCDCHWYQEYEGGGRDGAASALARVLRIAREVSP